MMVLRKYFTEMKAVFAEMYRVLRADSAAVVVVGPSIMRGVDVQTHHCLADIAAELGFDVDDDASERGMKVVTLQLHELPALTAH